MGAVPLIVRRERALIDFATLASFVAMQALLDSTAHPQF